MTEEDRISALEGALTGALTRLEALERRLAEVEVRLPEYVPEEDEGDSSEDAGK